MMMRRYDWADQIALNPEGEHEQYARQQRTNQPHMPETSLGAHDSHQFCYEPALRADQLLQINAGWARPEGHIEYSQELIERSHAAIARAHALRERSIRNLPRSIEQIVWMRHLAGEHDAAREAVLAFATLAKSCGLSESDTLSLLKDMVRTAKEDAGDTQNGGALEEAVLAWGKAACSR